jgi:hypothetical protein
LVLLLGACELGCRYADKGRRNQGDPEYCKDIFFVHFFFLNNIQGCGWFDSWLKQF